jgi:hypothetical protein
MNSSIFRLYKYLEPRRADAMIQAGSMRIGTLNVYRELEAGDTERGDVGEGTRILHSDDRPRVYNSTAELPRVLQRISCGPGGLATNGPNAIVIQNRIPDVYMYCVTETFDPAVMEAFGSACVSIEHPDEFFTAVDRELRTRLSGLGLSVNAWAIDRCFYGARRQNYHTEIPVHECFIKPPHYQHQAEVRAVWQPANLPIVPIAFECPAATQCCKRYA